MKTERLWDDRDKLLKPGPVIKVDNLKVQRSMRFSVFICPSPKISRNLCRLSEA